MYPDPLELEEEETLQGTIHKFRFLETWTELEVSSGEFTIIHCLKAWLREMQGQKPLKDVVRFDSHAPYHQKYGYVVGALTRAWTQSLSKDEKSTAVLRVLRHLETHGMPDKIARNAILRMHQKAPSNDWLKMAGTYFLQ